MLTRHVMCARRDYTRVEVSVCADCGGERAVLAPRDPDEVPCSRWALLRQTSEELTLARKARREKQAKDRKRREQRKLRNAPKAEKKDRRRVSATAGPDEGVEQGEGEENAREESEADGTVESGSASQESLGEEESNGSGRGEDQNSESEGEEGEDEDDEENLSRGEDVEENADEEEGQTSEGTVLTSQEQWRITPKEGRLIVHKPFAKGTHTGLQLHSCHSSPPDVVTTSVVRADQYPMYRETNWKYSSPCMCCLHASV